MPDCNYALEKLMASIKRLRGEDGCPWDKKQTTVSLKKYLLEEFEKIIAAIDKNDPENLCEELGDFLYLILMIGEINNEKGKFNVGEIISTINEKLIRRHPHVFDSPQTLDEAELRKQWSEIKKSE